MTKKTLFFLTPIILLLCCRAFAQQIALCPASESKKAVKYTREASEAIKAKKNYEQVKEILEKAVNEDTAYAEPWLLFGDFAYKKKDWPSMKKAYTRLIELCPDADADAHYRLGKYLYDTKKYKESGIYLKSFLDFAITDEKKAKDAELMILRADMISNPVPFNPQPVKGVSTPDPEYLAIISPDNEYCFFTRRYEEVKKGSLTPLSVEKFMVSKRIDENAFEPGRPMPYPFNQNVSNNEGGATVSKDNRFLYFTINIDGNFDIYYSELQKDKWSPILNLGEHVNDPKQWDSQPSISSDGKTLYFASYRDSVFGTSDILKTTKVNGTWSKPERLAFNTNGNEKSPFIHPDNKTIYFSSDSLPGMGGFDIFMCKKNANGSWGNPVNLGYPINTEADEVGFFVSTDGSLGYFASNKLSGSGGYDIYSFEIPPDKKPDKVLFVKGRVKGENDEVPLAAKIELRNVTTKEVIDLDYDTLTGKYASVVLFDADYIMTVKKDGAAYNSQYFSQKDSSIKGVVTSDLDVKKIIVGNVYKLNNIRFETNSSALNESSRTIIADFAEFLKGNPKVTVAIHGHTDTEGDPQSNLTLSNDRAKAVYNYLINMGIESARLSYKGFGQSKPVASNDTEEGRSQNRRTEFLIISK